MRQRRLVFALSGLALVLACAGIGAIRYAAALGAPHKLDVAVAVPVAASRAPLPLAFDPEDRLSGRTAGLFDGRRRSVMLGQVSALPPPVVAPAPAAPAPRPVAPAILALAAPPPFVPPLPPSRPAALQGTITLASLETPATSPIIESLSDVPMPPARPARLRTPDAVAAIVPEAAQSAVAPAAAAPDTSPQAPVSRPPDRSGTGPFKMGSAVYIRIFKQEGQLELWLKRDDRYALFKTYSICKWSGSLGPKLREGDYQSPEGFYEVSTRQLNPHSHYDRAFDVGYPNAFDRRQGYTGGAVMVHGDCKSVGCFAMTNPKIEEIYAYVEAAIKNGETEVPVHIFPFRLTDSALNRETKGNWASLWSAPHANLGGFWANLKEGYDLFEQTGAPPEAYACGNRYEFGALGKSCTRIAGW